MGHRTLVAVERDAGRYDCYRSHWGGTAVLSGHPETVVESALANGQPVATEVTVADVLALLDAAADEALVVRTGDDITGYLVRRLNVPVAVPHRNDAPWTDADAVPVILVPVSDAIPAERFDTMLRTAKGILGDAVDAGLVPRGMAERYLAVLVERHPDLPAESLWLRVATLGENGDSYDRGGVEDQRD